MYYLKVPLKHLSSENPAFEGNKKGIILDAMNGKIPSWAVEEGQIGIIGVEIIEE